MTTDVVQQVNSKFIWILSFCMISMIQPGMKEMVLIGGGPIRAFWGNDFKMLLGNH